MATPLLSLRRVSVTFGSAVAVDNLSLDVHAGERIALVGESGSGKTVTALATLQLLQNAAVRGEIRFSGADLLAKSEREMRAIRGSDIAMIFQEPMSALDPLQTIGEQIIEVLQQHEGLSRRAARARAIEHLSDMGVREPRRRVDSYPHQLSGGQRQRATIAIALACRPRLLVADEPTTALDVTIRARIVQLLLDAQNADVARRGKDAGMAVLLITHDLHLVRKFADRVAVLEKGHLVELSDTATLFSAPRHPYTKKLLQSQPQRALVPVPADAPIQLSARALSVQYKRRPPGWRGWWVHESFLAVREVGFEVRQAQTVGIVGESGSGKTTLGLAILGLLRPTSGSVEVEGRELSALTPGEKRALRSRLQVVFQDPFGSLSPRQTVEQIIGEGLLIHAPELSPAQRRDRIVAVLQEVGLTADIQASYPHEFSGGQRQRIAIARALAVRPSIVVLDEPTSALDVSIQRQVLDLLARLQEKYRLSYVLISHDIAVVTAMAHQVLVMHEGEIVESGETAYLLAHPRHPYTQRLLQAALA
jgi:microcin C transport system ATP-binding protein